MNRFKHYKETKKDDPVYLLFRNNKLVLTGSNAPRLFSSPEHYTEHKKAYNSCFLRSDELIKYVPERSGEWFCVYEKSPFKDGLDFYYKCGLCGCCSPGLYSYCPNCGAKMGFNGGEDAKY